MTSDRLNQLIKEYNQKADENNVENAIKTTHTNFVNYTFDAKEKLRNEYVQNLISSYKVKVENLRSDAAKEKQNIAGKMAAIKYPNLSSSETGFKSIGESQMSQAQNLLLSNPAPPKLISAIQDAFNMKRYDFAFNIIDHIMSYSNNPTSRLGQRQVIEAVQNTYNSFEGKNELDSAAKELRRVQLVENSIKEILDQLQYGKRFVMSGDLFRALSMSGIMTEGERNQALEEIKKGGNLTDYILAKKQITEVISGISYNF
jgi:hypothetical protein